MTWRTRGIEKTLPEDTLRVFVRALQTNRMIAITGALSTRGLGYPTWSEFVETCAEIAIAMVTAIKESRKSEPNFSGSSADKLVQDVVTQANEIKALLGKSGGALVEFQVLLWILAEKLRAIDEHMRHLRSGLIVNKEYQGAVLAKYEEAMATIFRTRTRLQSNLNKDSIVARLITDLGIKRFATLNYDMELERALMLNDDELQLIKESASRIASSTSNVARFRNKALFALTKRGSRTNSIVDLIGDPTAGRPIIREYRSALQRSMANGFQVESDIVDRERPERLFEFAIASTEIDRHVLHLHGRADEPASLVSNIRHYDSLYRLDDLYRDPFDHGLRVLFGGNPTLFVGVGMTEPEVTQTLRYFVSNSPLRRPAPSFVLWNAERDSDGKVDPVKRENRRLDFWARLGVRIIFDTDLGVSADDAEQHASLVKMIEAMPALVDRLNIRADRGSTIRSASPKDPATPMDPAFRSLASRFGAPSDEAYRMWGPVGLRQYAHDLLHAADNLNPFAGSARSPSAETPAARVVFARADTGFGRGTVSELIGLVEIADVNFDGDWIRHVERRNRLIIHAGFSYDSDAMLNGIAAFLGQRSRATLPGEIFVREARIVDRTIFNTYEPALVVINGADRFFGLTGVPLSAELDCMLRCALSSEGSHNNVQFLLLVTERLRPYCDALGRQLRDIPGSYLGHSEAIAPSMMEMRIKDNIRSRYLKGVDLMFTKRSTASPRGADDRAVISPAGQARIRRAIANDRDAVARTFFEAYLSPDLLKRLNVDSGKAYEILRTMSFIGGPVEASVLLHAPKVWAAFAETVAGTDMSKDTAVIEMFKQVVEGLRDLGLLLEIEPHDPPPREVGAASETGADTPTANPPPISGASFSSILWTRFGLHRSLAAYFRDRHGVPLNDGKLATTFNLSLFMSEPGDNFTPDSRFHEELGDLIDSFVGAWHDLERLGKADSEFRSIDVNTDLKPWTDELEKLFANLYVHASEAEGAKQSIPWRAHRATAARLRAALLLVRGYLSTGTLLKLDSHSRRLSPDQKGALTEHAQRLDRIIDSFGNLVTARAICVKAYEPKSDGEKETLRRYMGPEPLYADELIWLFNERGVVALAQGHLYDAINAFSRTAKLNDSTVERNYVGHNARRISLNRVATLIERGNPKAASRLLDRIERTVEQAPWYPAKTSDHSTAQGQSGRVAAIRQMFREPTNSRVSLGTKEYMREEILIVGMSTSYRGLIAQLQGDLHHAAALFDHGLAILRGLGENRAYAHFERHRAELQRFGGNKEQALKSVNAAIVAAQAAMQMDVLHRARVVRADILYQQESNVEARRRALEDIKEALNYSAQSDCFRVRVEASASLARHMRHGGDYDTALRYATDALTIACRYGYALQKIELRIEIGKILRLRGDPRAGNALLERASEIAVSKGYHLALERIRRARSGWRAQLPFNSPRGLSK